MPYYLIIQEDCCLKVGGSEGAGVEGLLCENIPQQRNIVRHTCITQ
jgi:hypothetical protein